MWLFTDKGSYVELSPGSNITIGRGNGNDIQTESQSASKNHAILYCSSRGKSMSFELEDLKSRNGTYVGTSLFELEKIQGKVEVFNGYYIKFGNSQKTFRIVDSLPEDLPPNKLSKVDTKEEELMYDFHINEEGPKAPALPVEESIHQSEVQSLALSPTAQSFSAVPRNMKISVEYPAEDHYGKQPISIHIDPRLGNGEPVGSKRESIKSQTVPKPSPSNLFPLEYSPPKSSKLKLEKDTSKIVSKDAKANTSVSRLSVNSSGQRDSKDQSSSSGPFLSKIGDPYPTSFPSSPKSSYLRPFPLNDGGGGGTKQTKTYRDVEKPFSNGMEIGMSSYGDDWNSKLPIDKNRPSSGNNKRLSHDSLSRVRRVSRPESLGLSSFPNACFYSWVLGIAIDDIYLSNRLEEFRLLKEMDPLSSPSLEECLSKEFLSDYHYMDVYAAAAAVADATIPHQGDMNLSSLFFPVVESARVGIAKNTKYAILNMITESDLMVELHSHGIALPATVMAEVVGESFRRSSSRERSGRTKEIEFPGSGDEKKEKMKGKMAAVGTSTTVDKNAIPTTSSLPSFNIRSDMNKLISNMNDVLVAFVRGKDFADGIPDSSSFQVSGISARKASPVDVNEMLENLLLTLMKKSLSYLESVMSHPIIVALSEASRNKKFHFSNGAGIVCLTCRECLERLISLFLIQQYVVKQDDRILQDPLFRRVSIPSMFLPLKSTDLFEISAVVIDNLLEYAEVIGEWIWGLFSLSDQEYLRHRVDKVDDDVLLGEGLLVSPRSPLASSLEAKSPLLSSELKKWRSLKEQQKDLQHRSFSSKNNRSSHSSSKSSFARNPWSESQNDLELNIVSSAPRISYHFPQFNSSRGELIFSRFLAIWNRKIYDRMDQAFAKWSSQMSQDKLKRALAFLRSHQLAVVFHSWLAYHQNKALQKRKLKRILRSLQLQAQGRLSRLFQRWKSQLFIANHDQTTNELLRVKRENWELQQQLKELIGTDKIREDYLLERTLNRELLLRNMELQGSLQQLDDKLSHDEQDKDDISPNIDYKYSNPKEKEHVFGSSALSNVVNENAGLKRQIQVLSNQLSQLLSISEEKPIANNFERNEGLTSFEEQKESPTRRAAVQVNSEKNAMKILQFEVVRLKNSLQTEAEKRKKIQDEWNHQCAINADLNLAVQKFEPQITKQRNIINTLKREMEKRFTLDEIQEIFSHM